MSPRAPRSIKPENPSEAYLPAVIRDLNKPVVDSAEYLQVRLNNQDIAQAVPKDPTCCAFANSLVRENPIISAHIYRSVAYLEYPRRIIRFMVPSSMRSELITLDRSGQMEEGEYWLSPIPESLRLGRGPKGETTPKAKRSGKKRPYHFTANIRPIARSNS